MSSIINLTNQSVAGTIGTVPSSLMDCISNALLGDDDASLIELKLEMSRLQIRSFAVDSGDAKRIARLAQLSSMVGYNTLVKV